MSYKNVQYKIFPFLFHFAYFGLATLSQKNTKCGEKYNRNSCSPQQRKTHDKRRNQSKSVLTHIYELH